jgi:hypothetical protein
LKLCNAPHEDLRPMMDETSHDLPDPLLNLTDRAAAGVTPLEQEVLDEYTRLLKNMNHVREQQRLFFLTYDFASVVPFA